MYNEKELKQFERWGVTPPSSQKHGVTPDDLAERMRQLKPTKWHLEGNRLIGMTDMGPLVQTIPTDYILDGTDKDGMPIFKKVKLDR